MIPALLLFINGVQQKDLDDIFDRISKEVSSVEGISNCYKETRTPLIDLGFSSAYYVFIESVNIDVLRREEFKSVFVKSLKDVLKEYGNNILIRMSVGDDWYVIQERELPDLNHFIEQDMDHIEGNAQDFFTDRVAARLTKVIS